MELGEVSQGLDGWWREGCWGTEADPIVVLGVPATDGRLPVIDGANAVTRDELSYWNERRSVIKIGGSNLPSDSLVPAWIYIEGLEIRGAHPDNSFTDDSGGSDTYADNAASVHVEQGEHITIRGCSIHGSGNGIFSGSGSSDLRIVGNHVYGNGIVGSIYEHNSYTESLGILFEANHYGPLRAGAGGNNLKDRSAGTVIRFNWIEDGNRQLDLVETDYDFIAQHASYAQTFVYGNVLYESRDDGNSQMIHFGGDGGGVYRGTLYLFHNTFLSLRSGNTTLVALSTDSQALDARNDLVASSAGPNTLALTNGRGASTWHNSYLPTEYRSTHQGSLSGSVDTVDVRTGDAPGFMDQAAGDLRLRTDSEAAGPTADHAAATAGYPVVSSFDPTQGMTARATHADPGAFER